MEENNLLRLYLVLYDFVEDWPYRENIESTEEIVYETIDFLINIIENKDIDKDTVLRTVREDEINKYPPMDKDFLLESFQKRLKELRDFKKNNG